MLFRKLFAHGLPQGLLMAALVVVLLASGLVTQAEAQRRNGTTLAAYKTIDICTVDETQWLYSGIIALWNEGAVDTEGLAITDCIQNKTGSGQFQDVPGYCTSTFDPALTEIPAGTTQLTALTFAYSIPGAPLTGDIRNIAQITIMNHSGSLGTPKGPEPKATWTGGVPPPCARPPSGCTYTQGYWGSKPGVVWPAPYERTAIFFLATKNGICTANCGGNPNDDVFEQLPKTWQEVLDTNVSVSQGYYQLAHQYIAAVLNIANGASVPQGVQDTLNLAQPWLAATAPSACTAGGSCGLQKDWAAILDLYNNGIYDGGPPHCSDES
jgi:hypothetical protein